MTTAPAPEIAPQVTYENVAPFPRFSQTIRTELAQLYGHHKDLQGCHLLVELVPHRAPPSERCRVRLELTFSPDRLVVHHEQHLRIGLAETALQHGVAATIRFAFESAWRRLHGRHEGRTAPVLARRR